MAETTVRKNDVARGAILASIRGSLATSKPFDAEHQKYHGRETTSRNQIRQESSTQELVDNFKTNLEAVGGLCAVVANETEAANYVETLIKKIGAKVAAISDSALVNRLTGTLHGVNINQNASKDL